MMLTEQLKSILADKGAALVGCADLSEVSSKKWKCGVSVAVPVPVSVVKGIEDGPTREYFQAYHEVESLLDQIVLTGEAFLLEQGYAAFAQTSTRIREDSDWRTEIPHKTVATNAGIGWIGKSCLLVTKEFGSAIRISSILTDAPLVCDKPIRESQCAGCNQCVKACPAQALSGIAWNVEIDRDRMLNKEACVEKQIELTRKRTGIETEFLCGRCFAVCPFTQRYIKEKDSN